MSRWELIDTTEIPGGGGELRLFGRDDEFAIRIAGGQGDLMNSRTHGSEDALGQLACEPLRNRAGARVLIGGLGMGFTLAAALACLPADAELVVAELVPGVVVWNRDRLGVCAGFPLEDPRVSVETADVGELIRGASAQYDAILLDVDNGPEGLTHPDNDRLYSLEGLSAAYRALKPSGTLAVWSVSPAKAFVKRMRSVGFDVDERRIRAHRGKGSRHVVWLSRRARAAAQNR
jgi:spermidine synthase